MRLIEHENLQTLHDSVAIKLGQTLHKGQREHQPTTLALAGGSTPLPIYRQLATSIGNRSQLRWLPTDERWVATDQPASNLYTIRRAFAATGAQALSLVPPRPGAVPDTRTAGQTLRTIGQRRFDAVVLGMGTDGHFASLFPGSIALDAGLSPDTDLQALVCSPEPLPPEAPFPRITLTLARLLHTQLALLVIHGQAKLATLRMATHPDASTQQFPVAALLRCAGSQLEIHWSP